MIRKYLFRKNFKGFFESDGASVSAHLAFKTRTTCWLNTPHPVLALVSVHSAFHEGGDGFLKMEAFLSTITSCVTGKVAILIADTAHFHTRYLLEGHFAKENCLRAAEVLAQRFRSLFAGCELIHWNTLCQDIEYELTRSRVLALFRLDEKFQRLLAEDAQRAYTEKRGREFPDRNQFIEKAIEELLEQCIFLQLLAQRGYRYLFYPGIPWESTEYLNAILNRQLEWVDVFLTIEKKTRMLTAACSYTAPTSKTLIFQGGARDLS